MTPGTLRGYLRRNRNKRRAGKPGAVVSKQSTGGNAIEESVCETAPGKTANDARPPVGTPGAPSPRRRSRTAAAQRPEPGPSAEADRRRTLRDERHAPHDDVGRVGREFRRNELDGAAALAGCPGGTTKSRPDAASGGALRAALTGSYLRTESFYAKLAGEGRQLRSLFRGSFRIGRGGSGGAVGVTGRAAAAARRRAR